VPAAADQRLTSRQRALGLMLPPGNPRSRALATEWATTYPDPAARVQAALHYFGQAPFSYSLKPPRLGDQQVDSFLFDTRRGFCEHYASSFVFLMRAAGVPARVVIGYQGGEYNPVGHNYTIRQADAHAWAEVWLADRGWVRVDPTAAVSPDRVERGIEALADQDAANVRALREPGWLRSLRWGVDGAVYRWQRWVLQYNRQQQQRLLDALGLGGSAARVLLLGMAGLSLLALIPLLVRQWTRRSPSDPVQRLHARFCQLLARHGCERGAAEGPRDFALRASQALPGAAAAVQGFTRHYLRLRYAPPSAHAASELAALRQALRAVQAALRH
jgi:hypothetical protein